MLTVVCTKKTLINRININSYVQAIYIIQITAITWRQGVTLKPRMYVSSQIIYTINKNHVEPRCKTKRLAQSYVWV